MKKLNERWPFILFIFLSVVLVVVLLVPTSLVNAAEILKCQSGTCKCICADPYQCQCCAGGGKCSCVCINSELDDWCPRGGGGGGGTPPPDWY